MANTRGTHTFGVTSKVNIVGENVQDLKKFADALNSLTKEQVYDYLKGKKLFEIYEYKHSSMQKIIDKYKNQSQKNSEMLKYEVNDLEQKVSKRLSKLEKNIEYESQSLYNLFKNADILEDNANIFDNNSNLENIKEEDLYFQIELEFEMEVDYEYYPYVPATMWEPAEGGYPELDDYDAWDETYKKIVDLFKILNINSSCDFDIEDCEYPDEDVIRDDIQDYLGSQEQDDYYYDY